MSADERGAFIVGLQVTALCAAVYFNVVGYAIGVNLYIASVPFFVTSFTAPYIIKAIWKRRP